MKIKTLHLNSGQEEVTVVEKAVVVMYYAKQSVKCVCFIEPETLEFCNWLVRKSQLRGGLGAQNSKI